MADDTTPDDVAAPAAEPAPKAGKAPTSIAAVPDLPTEEADGVLLLKAGRIRFVIQGHAHTLRPPLLGEIKAFRIRWNALGDDLPDADQAERSEQLETLYSRLEDLLRWTFTKLSDRPFPTGSVDDLPSWLFSSDIPLTLFQHWQAVPLLPGA